MRVYPLAASRAPDGGLEPFPTLYWLSCPVLFRRVAELEAAGWIKRLERRLQAEPELRAACRADHADYIRRRWQALSGADRGRVRRRGWEKVFFSRGVAGIAGDAALKCLHAQLAFHLAAGSRIGGLLLADFDLAGCAAPAAAGVTPAGDRDRPCPGLSA